MRKDDETLATMGKLMYATAAIKESSSSCEFNSDHAKFGHVPLDILKRITGKRYKSQDVYCKPCALGKMVVKAFNKTSLGEESKG